MVMMAPSAALVMLTRVHQFKQQQLAKKETITMGLPHTSTLLIHQGEQKTMVNTLQTKTDGNTFPIFHPVPCRHHALIIKGAW